MVFGPSYSTFVNPYIDNYEQTMTGYANNLMPGKMSRGVRFGNQILKGLMAGDTSRIGNPFMAGLASAERNVDTNIDGLMDASLAKAQANLQKSRLREQAGVNFENYVRGMAGQAMGLSENARQANLGAATGLLSNAGQLAQGKVSREYNPGWGASIMGPLIGAGMAAATGGLTAGMSTGLPTVANGGLSAFPSLGGMAGLQPNFGGG